MPERGLRRLTLSSPGSSRVCVCVYEQKKLWETNGGFSSKLHISEQTFAHRDPDAPPSPQTRTRPVSQAARMFCALTILSGQHRTATTHG